MTRILVLGASGTLGHMLVRVLSEDDDLDVWGTVRSAPKAEHFSAGISSKIRVGVQAENVDDLMQLFAEIQPEVVINCIGIIKHSERALSPLHVLPINSLLPHRLEKLCDILGARLIHFSTDCVFSGARGDYIEADAMDADDLYGQSKYIGEVATPSALTIRTSFIGHELDTSRELIEWFMRQAGPIKGYTRAIYTGLPTVVLSRVVRDVVLPRADLSGLYHVASEPISKFELLSLVAKVYGKTITIEPDDQVRIDRSLNGTKFREATGFAAPSWPVMIEAMHDYR